MAGGTSKAGALQRAVEKRARLPVEVLDAFRQVEMEASVEEQFARTHSPEALVSVGLALRAQGDK